MHTLTILTILSGLCLVPCLDSFGQFGGRRGGDWNRDRDDDDGDDDRRRGRDRDDDDDRRGEDRDRGDRGRGRGGWGGNPEDFWKRFDKNGDGMIAPDEVDERFRDRLGIDKPVKIGDLVSRFQRNRDERGRDGDRGRDRGRDDRRSEEEKPLVPGFGVEEDENATVPGFGPPEEGDEEAEEDNESSSSQSAASSNSSGGGGVTGNAYVNGVMEKFDANDNGELEGDEIRAARLPGTADANNDGKMTREELVKAFPAKSSSTSSESPSGSRRSYRFASAHERLNGSAKSWIVSRDKNGDGQVAMHEFSRTWNDSKIREFQRYDRNGDGIVTAEEYESR